MYFRTCRSCGAHIDPGERCDCREKPAETEKEGSSMSGAERPGEESRRLFKDTA